MCDKNSKIHLCTCSNIDKEEFFTYDNLNHPILIKWTLHKLVKNEWTGIDGMLMEPENQFNTELTVDFLCNGMNANHCFDFEYYPVEGDTIIFNIITYTKSSKKIKKRYRQNLKFMSLIYRSEYWIIDTYDAFYNTTEEIKKGFLKLKP